MRNLKSLIIIVLLFSVSAHAQEVQNAAADYQVPTYEAKSLDIHGEDLFRYNDAEEFSLNVGSDFLMTKQNPMSNMTIGNTLDFSMGTQFGADGAGTEQVGHTLTDILGVGYQRFIGGSRGLNIGVNLLLSLASQAGDGVDGTTTTNVITALNVGYGRLVNARPLAQAAAMCKAAGQTCDAKKLLEIGEVIGQFQAGYFAAKFKADANVEFYAALLKAIGGGNAFKMAQILTSPIYNIGNRNVGWQAGVRLINGMGDLTLEEDDEETNSSMMVQQYADYAALLNDNMGYTVSQTFTMGMDDDFGLLGHPGKDNMVLSVNADLNVDHGAQWNTQVQAAMNMRMADAPDVEAPAENAEEGEDQALNGAAATDAAADDSEMNWRVSAMTNYALGSKAIASAALNVCGGNTGVGVDGTEYATTCLGDDDMHYSVMASFRYFIF